MGVLFLALTMYVAGTHVSDGMGAVGGVVGCPSTFVSSAEAEKAAASPACNSIAIYPDGIHLDSRGNLSLVPPR